MKNKIAIVVCLLAVTAVAMGNKHNRRTLEERVEALEAQVTQLTYIVHQDTSGDVIVRGNLVVQGDYLITKRLYYTEQFQY